MFSFTVTLLLLLAAVVVPTQSNYAGRPLSLASVYDGDFSDAWNRAVEEGTSADKDSLTTDYGVNLTSRTFKSVSPDAVTAVYQQLYDDGTDIIITTNFAHATQFLAFAAAHPDQKFIVSGGLFRGQHNVYGTYGKIYQAFYVAGYLCGLSTKSGKVGYVGIAAQKPFSVNAFAAGAVAAGRSDIQVIHIQSASANDSVIEAAIATNLVSRGVDCAMGAPQPGSYKAFAALNVSCIATYEDKRYINGEVVQTSILYNWTSLYMAGILSHLAGNFSGGRVAWGNLGETITRSAFSSHVPADIQKKVSDMWTAVAEEMQQIFCGSLVSPLYSRINANDPTDCLNFTEITTMTRYLPFISNPINMTHDQALTKLTVPWDGAIAIVMSILTSIVIAVCVALGVLFFLQRGEAVIKSSSPTVMYLVFLGLATSLASVYAWFGTPNALACQARVWLPVLGFGLALSAIAGKTWRIHSLYHTDIHKKIVKITDLMVLARCVAPIVTGEFVILIAWTVAAPMSLVISETDPLLKATEANMRCVSQSIAPYIIAIVYNVAVLIAVAYFAVRTRNIKSANYQESEAIALSLYQIIIWLAVAAFVLLGVSYTVWLEALIVAIALNIMAAGVMFFLARPRAVALYQGLSELGSSVSSHSTGTLTSNSGGARDHQSARATNGSIPQVTEL